MNSITTRVVDFLSYSSSFTLMAFGVFILSAVIAVILGITLYKRQLISKFQSLLLLNIYTMTVVGILVGSFISSTNKISEDKFYVINQTQLILSECAIRNICYGPEKDLSVKTVNDIHFMKQKGYYSNINLQYLLNQLQQITEIGDKEELRLQREMPTDLKQNTAKYQKSIEI